jgi:hypothetical protein
LRMMRQIYIYTKALGYSNIPLFIEKKRPIRALMRRFYSN